MYVTYTRGFTLIELLIVMAVVGILTAMAYPSYTEPVRKSRRSDVMIELMEVAQILERCYTHFGSVYDYTDCPTQSTVEITSLWGFYRVVPTVTATPVVDGPQAADIMCTAFTLINTGVKTATGGLGDTCWD